MAQAKSNEVGQFLDLIPSNQLFITDFAFHSICVILNRLKQKTALLAFVQDVFVDGAVSVVSIDPAETRSLLEAMDKYNLDFDDAYQYLAADLNDLMIVSFDSDLNATAKGKKTPGEIIAGLRT